MTKTHVDHILQIVPGTLHAIRNEQPMGTHTFYVMVDVETEVDWKVKLVAAVPQGTNPLEKLLRFDVVKPGGIHPGAISRRTVRYEEVPPGAAYASVLLEDGKETKHVQVEVVV